MIIRMTTRSGRQRSYDHRLRDLVQRTGDLPELRDRQHGQHQPEQRRQPLNESPKLQDLPPELYLREVRQFQSERLPDEKAKLRILSAIDRRARLHPVARGPSLPAAV